MNAKYSLLFISFSLAVTISFYKIACSAPHCSPGSLQRGKIKRARGVRMLAGLISMNIAVVCYKCQIILTFFYFNLILSQTNC
jgi:hypothetical protein